MRLYETGASRDTDEEKLDIEGFFSPRVLLRRAEYMHEHREQDDHRRDGDNWQKGIPVEDYMKSLLRHVFHVWELWRELRLTKKLSLKEFEDALCAVCFNAEGILFELSKLQVVAGGVDEADDSVREMRVDRQDEPEYGRPAGLRYPMP